MLTATELSQIVFQGIQLKRVKLSARCNTTPGETAKQNGLHLFWVTVKHSTAGFMHINNTVNVSFIIPREDKLL